MATCQAEGLPTGTVEWKFVARARDLIVTVFLFLPQVPLGVAALRHIRAQAGWRRNLASALGLAAAAGLVVSYACSFSWMLARFPIAPILGDFLGGLALAYLLASGASVLLYLGWLPVRERFLADADPERRRLLGVAGKALLAAPAAVIGYGAVVQRTQFQVREVDLALPGLPADLEGLRLLQISDIHLGAFLSERELARVIDAGRELRPHVVFATGDFISTIGDPLEVCLQQVARLKADAGILGCLGNHERYARAEAEATRLAARLGIRILRQENQTLRFGAATLNVAGVDHQESGRKLYLRGAERLVYPGAVNLLLSHNPDVFPVAARKGYDLMLSGHTHGGQVTVEILDFGVNPARFITPYVRGEYHLEAATAYVTRGIGTIGIPARIGAPPELSLLRLRKA